MKIERRAEKCTESMNYWLIKSEPSNYSWSDLVRDGQTVWDGVRNYGARNNLQSMKKGDLCLFYHSVSGKEILGVARVIREAYPDPTADDPQWVAVTVEPAFALKQPVTLAELKADPFFREMELIRLSRLSVAKVRLQEYRKILKWGGKE